MSDERVLTTATQVALFSSLLLVAILSVSALLIYRVSERIFIGNYSAEMKKIFLDSSMGKGQRYGVGRNPIGRGGTEFYVEIDGLVLQNPTGLIGVPEVEGYSKTKIDGNSYLFYGFSNGKEKVLLGARMDDLDFFLESLSRTLLLTLAVGIVLSIAGGGLLGNRVAKPIRETAALLKKITLEDLSRRVQKKPKTSELAELKEAINATLDRIEDGYRRQEQFSSDIAHEIRSPLTSILGYSSLLERWGTEDPIALKQAAASIGEAARRMMSLTEALLFLSKPEIEVKGERFELSELIRELLKEMSALRGAKVVLEVPPVEIESDRTLLKIALKILLENALKYGEGKPLELSWSENSLLLRDHGRGIVPGESEKIFDRFYRGDSARSGEGHGLGLSIVRKICDALKLAISAQNNPQGGTVFKLEGFK